MRAFWRNLFGLKGDTRNKSVDKYVYRLDSKAREDMVKVEISLKRLQAELNEFQNAVDKLRAELPGQQKQQV